MNSKLISVIIPCYNESLYIEKLLLNLIKQDYPKSLLEILIIDGISSDGTDLIIDRYCKQYSYIKLFKNYNKIVPNALNLGIINSTGDIIIRMDAHSLYPDNYISKLVYYLEELNADNVGGVWITKPANNSIKALTIAEATSSIFGIGNADYRLSNNEIKEVDTVPFGCYRREIFNKIGLFDTDLTRNQDDEFNARLKKAGGKIFLIPGIKIEYFARESWAKMAKMFYQYGFFKALVLKKLAVPATIRQFFPLAFLIYLVTLMIVAVFSPLMALFYSVFLLFYLILSLAFSVKISLKNDKYNLIWYMPVTFLIIHLSYGWGYLKGVFKFLLLNEKTKINEVSTTR